SSRQMPPSGAGKGFGPLSPDNSLTQEEIMVIAAWVVGGAPKGSPAFLPALTPANQTLHRSSPMRDALIVNNRRKIDVPLIVAGIRPMATTTVESVRILADFPDGHVEPLLWLFHYNPMWHQA